MDGHAAAVVHANGVGRTPTSALDPLVRLYCWCGFTNSRRTEADEGVGRGPGGPPYIEFVVFACRMLDRCATTSLEVPDSSYLNFASAP
jgi:hypothetical protein